MNAYRSVIAGALVLALVSVFLFVSLDDQGATLVAAMELIALIVLDWCSSAYIGWLSFRDRRRPRSWLLLMLVTSTAMTTAGISAITWVVTRRLFGLPPLESGLGLRIIAVALIVIACVPVMKAALFFLVQRDPSASLNRRIGDVPQ